MALATGQINIQNINETIQITLSKDNHVFAGSATAALAGTADVTIKAFRGTTQVDFTIQSITPTMPTGLSWAEQTRVGLDRIVRFTASTGLVQPSGSFIVTLRVNGVDYIKVFSYAIAFVGTNGTNGTAGKGISSTVVTYQAGTSGTVAPTGTWTAGVPAVSASQYLWTKIYMTYTDATNTTSYAVGLMGAAARTYFIESDVSAVIEKEGGSDPITFTSFYKDGAAYSKQVYPRYWKVETTVNGTTWTTLSSLTASTASTFTTPTIPFETSKVKATLYYDPALTVIHDSVTLMVVRNGAPGKIGPEGPAGKGAITMLLSNPVHIVPATYGGDATSFGDASCGVSIREGLDDVTSSWTITATPSTGVDGLYGSNRYTVTDLTVDYGYVDFLATRIGYPNMTGRFSLTLSKAGQPGEAAPVANIMPSSLLFKSMDGGGVFLPTDITLVPQIQEAVFEKWEYSLADNLTWSTAETGTFGMTIDPVTKNLTLSNISSLFTSSNSTITFKLKTTTTNIYDVITIAKLVDVLELEVGGRNLLLLSNVPKSSTSYIVGQYTLTEDWKTDSLYTISIKGTLINGQKFEIKRDGDTADIGLAQEVSAGVYTLTFKAPALTTPGNRGLTIRNYPSGETTATIEWIKLEKGRVNTDYTESPEDVDSRIASKMENNANAIIAAISDGGKNDIFYIEPVTNKIYLKATAIQTAGLKADYITAGMLKSVNGQTYIDLDTGDFSLGDGAISFVGNVFTIDLAKTSLKDAFDEKANKGDLETISQYLTFDEVNGLTIGQKDLDGNISSTNVNINSSALNFNDGGKAVATITNQQMSIKSVDIEDTLIIGVHQIAKYDAEITLITWVG